MTPAFTEDARAVIAAAQDLAGETGGTAVSGLHLLAALLSLAPEPVPALLAAQEVDPRALEDATRAALGWSPRTGTLGVLPFTADAVEAIERAIAVVGEAGTDGGVVHAGHLLVAIAQCAEQRRAFLFLTRPASRAATLLRAARFDAGRALPLRSPPPAG